MGKAGDWRPEVGGWDWGSGLGGELPFSTTSLATRSVGASRLQPPAYSLRTRAAGHANRARAKRKFVRRRSPLRARAFSIQIKKMGSPTLRERRRRGMILDCHGPGSSSRRHPRRWPRPRLHVSPPDWQATVQRAGTAESARSTENGSRMQRIRLGQEAQTEKLRPRRSHR